MPIRLAVGGVTNRRCVQGVGGVCFVVCAKCCKCVVLREVLRWGMCVCCDVDSLEI